MTDDKTTEDKISDEQEWAPGVGVHIDLAGGAFAMYHAQIHWVRRMFEAVDMAMEDEGVDEPTRLRVLRSVMYGAADESEAAKRMHDREKRVVALQDLPTAWTQP